MLSTNYHLNRKKAGKIIKAIVFIIAVIGAIISAIPFIWMVSTALKPLDEAMRYPPTIIPENPSWKNFKEAWSTYVPFNKFFLNTVIITVPSVLGNVFVSALAAFGFSHLTWRFREFFFMLLLSTMMLPYHVTMIPIYIIFRRLEWIDTFYPLIVPNLFGSAFYIFLLRQFLLGLPKELDDAARIDGASSFMIFWKIVLPLCKPALMTAAIMSFTANWNNFMGPLIYLNKMEKMTLSVGLSMFQGTYYAFYNLMMAAALITLLPLLILFFIGQRYFIEGIVLTGLKR
jgi:multiple sugar transport system permease protein